MAPRAYWKGYLKLSLVSCPIALYPASSSSERVSFNRINTKTGNRLKQQMVDAGTGEPVEKDDIGRGYEYAKGQYIIVDDDELAKIKIESTHTIDIDRFVPRTEIDDRYLDSPYYMSPTDQVGQEAFSVIRDAMREKKMVGLARVVLTRREHVVLLEPFDKGLLATTLATSALTSTGESKRPPLMPRRALTVLLSAPLACAFCTMWFLSGGYWTPPRYF